jgi:hypothetical protein
VTLLFNPTQGTARIVTGLNPGNLPATLVSIDWHDLDPRVGFAYSPRVLRGKAVFRAVYGIFTQKRQRWLEVPLPEFRGRFCACVLSESR